MSEFYTPPESDLDPQQLVRPPDPRVGKALAILSCLILAAFVYAMWQIGAATSAGLDAYMKEGNENSELIGEAMRPGHVSGAIGLFAGILGLLIALLTAVFSGYRSRGFFSFSMLNSILYLIAFPVGTIVSIAFIGYLIAKRHEFLIDPAES